MYANVDLKEKKMAGLIEPDTGLKSMYSDVQHLNDTTGGDGDVIDSNDVKYSAIAWTKSALVCFLYGKLLARNLILSVQTQEYSTVNPNKNKNKLALTSPDVPKHSVKLQEETSKDTDHISSTPVNYYHQCA